MTSPMAHPLTPREKVAEIVRDGMSRLAASQAGARPVVSASKEADRVTDAILTALASGSVDHAELARLAEAVIKGDDSLAAAVRSLRAFHAAANPATVLALLAEIAALRAQSDFYKRDNDVLMKNTWVSRATEAERKLAEAVEWRPIETAPRDGTVVIGWSSFFPTRRPLEVSWDDDRCARKPAPRWVACAAAYSRRAFFEHPLTHWLPLPPAPGAEA